MSLGLRCSLATTLLLLACGDADADGSPFGGRAADKGSGNPEGAPAAELGSTPAAGAEGAPTVTLGAPSLLAPAQGVLVDSVRPTFALRNATRSGTGAPTAYTIEVAQNESFAPAVATFDVTEQEGETRAVVPRALPMEGMLFWRARAVVSTVFGAWSTTETLRTPNEAIDLQQATIFNSPDVKGWATTAKITRIDINADGIHVEHTKRDGAGSWPDVPFITEGEDLQYTIWMVVNQGGKWYTAGGLQFWRGLDRMGGPPSQYAEHWYYDPVRWELLATHQPAVGELVGFFVTAGNQRNTGGAALVFERSKIVMVPFPSDAGAVYDF